MHDAQTRVLPWIRRALVAILLWSPIVHADVVTDWSAIALNLAVSSANPVLAQRTMAAVYVAMFEAMNFIEGGYVPRFLVKSHTLPGVSSEAAAASAAHYVLVQLYPKQKLALDQSLANALAGIPNREDKNGGRITGTQLGAIIYAVWPSDRASDAHSMYRGFSAEPLIWHPIVARLIEAQRLKPIEVARIFALVSLAVSDIYSDSGIENVRDLPCTPCSAGTAVLTILESEHGSVNNPKIAIATTPIPASAVGLTPVRDAAGEIGYRDRVWIADEKGKTIALRVLAYFRPVWWQQ